MYYVKLCDRCFKKVIQKDNEIETHFWKKKKRKKLWGGGRRNGVCIILKCFSHTKTDRQRPTKMCFTMGQFGNPDESNTNTDKLANKYTWTDTLQKKKIIRPINIWKYAQTQ